MMTKDILLGEETLFKDIEVFNPEYIPDQFNFRDGQLKEMAFALKPGLRGGRPGNAYIIGNPATGKTTAVKLVFGQLRESEARIIPVYINCHLNSSPFKVFSEIRKAVLGMPAPDTGIPITKVQEEVFNRLAKGRKALVVALDDFDFLVANNTADTVLYSILRAHESVPGAICAVFAISVKEYVHKFDDRVRSIFSPIRIHFPPYGSDEIYSILKARCDAGLYSGVLGKVLLEKIAEKTRDLRFGIELVKQAVLSAEADANRVVKEKHLEKAVMSMQSPEASGDNILILNIVREKGPIESGQLFDVVKTRLQISYSTFYRALKTMRAANLIEIEAAEKSKGRTSIIKSK